MSIAIAHRTDTVDLAFAPDGRRIATAGKDRMLQPWDGHHVLVLDGSPIKDRP